MKAYWGSNNVGYVTTPLYSNRAVFSHLEAQQAARTRFVIVLYLVSLQSDQCAERPPLQQYNHRWAQKLFQRVRAAPEYLSTNLSWMVNVLPCEVRPGLPQRKGSLSMPIYDYTTPLYDIMCVVFSAAIFFSAIILPFAAVFLQFYISAPLRDLGSLIALSYFTFGVHLLARNPPHPWKLHALCIPKQRTIYPKQVPKLQTCKIVTHTTRENESRKIMVFPRAVGRFCGWDVTHPRLSSLRPSTFNSNC